MVRRVLLGLAAVAVAMVCVVAVGIWLFIRDAPQRWPEVSAYSNGHLVRVGPYLRCSATGCETPQTLGELAVTDRYPVQLSVPTEVGREQWVLRAVFEDPRNDPPPTTFGANARQAVTLAPVDPQRGRLVQVVVQALIQQADGSAYAEWSVRLVGS